MKPADEKRIAARLAKLMAMMCVRNTGLETLHAGSSPVSRVGDYSDVFVLDADGRKIPWAEVSHLDDHQMWDLMREIVDRLYTFQISYDDPEFMQRAERWMTVAGWWDEPELDRTFPDSISYASGEPQE